MMFTKKKMQAISALCAVMMLISLMTCFVLPASAESLVYPDAGEVISATGLYDASALPDIKDYPQSGNEYKVTDVEGMKKIADLVNRENKDLSGVTIYQMADIDFAGTAFDGIGVYGRGTDVAFAGTFDGNGFVIENLFIHGISYVGLFNYASSSAILKNIGVASGLVVGGEYAGVICGLASGVKLINCWNAATIFGGSRSGAGAGSLTGNTSGSAALYNCFNVGMVLNCQFFAAGISGRVDDSVELKNSFNAGSLFYCHSGESYPAGYQTNAFYRNNSKGGALTPGTLNSYYISSLTVPSCEAETGKMDPAQFADGTVAEALNNATGTNAVNALGAVNGYTVSYSNTSDLDFPVLTYSVGDEVKVRRVPHTTVNVNNDHSDWTDKSAFWRDFMPRYCGGYKAVGTVELGTANDLYLFALMSSVLNNPDSDNKMTNINITADIDMNDVTLPGIPRNAEGEPYSIPLGGMSWQTSQAYGMDNLVIDGQGHSIYNWNVYSSNMGDVANSGFVGYIGSGTVQNLNLVGATVTRSNDMNDYSAYNNKRNLSAGLLVGSCYSSAKILNCTATGTVYYLNHTNKDADISTVGGLLADAQFIPTIANSWTDCTVVTADGEILKGAAVGFAKVEIAPENLSNTFFAAPEMPSALNDYTTNMQVHCLVNAINSAEFAYRLSAGGLGPYTLNEDGYIVKGTADQVPAQVRFVMAINGEEAAELEYDYFVPGSEITPRTYAGFTLDKTSLPSGADSNTGIFMMGNNTVVLEYTNDYVNLLPVREVIEKLESFDLELFKDANPAIAALMVADEMLADYGALEAAQSTEDLATINAEVLDLVRLSNNLDMELLNVYPKLVPYAEKDLYAQFGEVDNYLLSNLDDWLAVVASLDTFAGKTLHLANDIDLANYPVTPLILLEGTLDGHGYRFENVVIPVVTRGLPVGLISLLDGTVKNVGIASGLVAVQYEAELDDYGVGALVGMASSNAKMIACWNAATVAVESMNEAVYENPVAGLIGYCDYGAVIDTCYNIGLVSGGDLVADLANGYPIVYNSYGAGDLYCTYGMSPYVVGGYEFGGAQANITNTYGVGVEKLMTKDADYATANILDWDAYTSAQVGWEINQNYEYTMLQERVYFTEDMEGYPVFAEGTLAQQKKVQLRRVVIEKSNGEVEYEYVAGGDSAVLDTLLVLDMEMADESKDLATLEGNVLNVNTVTDANESRDVVIYAEVSPLLTDALVEEVLYFLFKDPNHFANPDGIIELVNRILTTEYTTQSAVDADVIALRALKVYSYDKSKLPSVMDAFLYDDAPGYTINSFEDLNYVATYPEEFGSDKVLYLTTDLEMYGKKYNGIAGLAASVDGLGHSINGYVDAHALLIDFAGAYIKNLNIDNAFVAVESDAGVLVDEVLNAAVIENVSITNSVLLNGIDAPAGLLVGTANAALTVKNCEVVGSAALHFDEEVEVGLMVGYAADVTFNNVGIFDSTTNGDALLAANVANKASAVNVFTADNIDLPLFTKAAAVSNEKVYAGDGYVSVDAMNAALVDANVLWNMNGETGYPALVTEGKYEKFTITFERNDAVITTGYTDVNGKLYAPDAHIRQGKWDVKGPITEAVFTADTTVVAMLEGNIVVKPTNVAKPGEQVNVTVSIENNPGLQGVDVNVAIDYDHFELLAIESGTLFDPANFIVSEDALTSGAPFQAIASGYEKVFENGVIFSMTLKVKDTVADDNYENAVVVTVNDHVDVNHNRSVINNGACTIAVSSQGFLWGDVNNDGIVLTDDAVLIMRSIVGIATPEMTNAAVGDLDGRTGLSVADAQMILHYLANPGTVLQPVNP